MRDGMRVRNSVTGGLEHQFRCQYCDVDLESRAQMVSGTHTRRWKVKRLCVYVCVCMCMYAYVCMYVCMCMYVCICLCLGVLVFMSGKTARPTGRKQGREREDLTAASLQCMERVLVLGVWCLVSGAQGFVHLVWAVTLKKTHPRKRNSWDTQLPM
jgi:Flp pilus assembly protein TadB